MPSQTGDGWAPEAPAPLRLASVRVLGAWNSPEENHGEDCGSTGMQFQELGRTGDQSRNEVQLEANKVPFAAHLNLRPEN